MKVGKLAKALRPLLRSSDEFIILFSFETAADVLGNDSRIDNSRTYAELIHFAANFTGSRDGNSEELDYFLKAFQCANLARSMISAVMATGATAQGALTPWQIASVAIEAGMRTLSNRTIPEKRNTRKTRLVIKLFGAMTSVVVGSVTAGRYGALGGLLMWVTREFACQTTALLSAIALPTKARKIVAYLTV